MHLKKVLLIVTLALATQFAQAQFDRKVNVQGYLGYSFFPQDEELIGLGDVENIFAGYHGGVTIGGKMLWLMGSQLSLGGGLEFVTTSKDDYDLSNFAVGFNVKYNFVPAEKKISPFILVQGSASFVSLSQVAHEKMYYPENTGATGVIPVDGVLVREQTRELKGVPAFGLNGSLGIDFNLKPTFGFFVAYDQAYVFTKNAKKFKDNYPTNDSNLSFGTIKLGVNVKMFQKKSLY